MKKLLAALIAALAFVARANAQPVADHLQCYKVTDPQAKTKYTADLDGLVVETGCTIKVPAAMACVPATKTNVTPPPPGGGGTGTPNSFFCYKVKCPKVTLPALAGLACSCTIPTSYWSSTSYAMNATLAWAVNFYDGGVAAFHGATVTFAVRGVRGGS